ncbi:MAG: glycoside hydrolase family 13 protein, partial [Chitinophagaceae bacterium]|nr:glycoside hydrolase family 13 protein [Anaerolineae bacterium]
MKKQYFLIVLLFLVIGVSGTSLSLTAQDNGINSALLLHDSRDDLYRNPFGAVPIGTTVTLRLRAAHGDLDAVGLRLYSSAIGTVTVLPLHVTTTTPDGYDLWEIALPTGDVLTVYYYRFLLSKDGEVFIYEDDSLDSEGNLIEFRKGGSGVTLTNTTSADYQIAVYDPEYYTPEWMRNAVIYQIFPDRFRDGDASNNPTDDSDTFYGDVPLYFHETWNEPMLNGRVDLLPNGTGYWNSDFFGGDLAGITEKLDYLQSLGVTAIYLNPIFEARSNHRYDTADYMTIDRRLGTMDDFHTLVSQAEERGMHLILDGVLNHLSSDSLFFDRYHRYETDGACESAESEWRNWFTFVAAEANQPAPCAGENDDVYYRSWANFDSIPQVNNTVFATRAYFVRGENSVVRTWGAEGIGGWRLDAAEQVDDGRDPENGYWENFRTVARLVNPETVIVGEFWHDSSEWLLGDEWDSVTNYRFRRALLGFVRGNDFTDNDGVIVGLRPSEFDAAMRSVEEDTPSMAYHAMMNIVDSHDTTRALFALDNSQDALKLAALVQFTFPGAPTIYYGDEIALNAPDIDLQDDPFNRAPYPWPDEEGDFYPAPDEAMLTYYQTLGQARQSNTALRSGDLVTLVADDERGIYAFVRIDADAGNAALVVVNTSTEQQTVELNFESLLPNNLMMEPLFNQGDFSSDFVTDQGMANLNIAAQSGNVWLSAGVPDLAFATPQPPVDLTAEAETGMVRLNWDAVEDAVGTIVYRSPVAIGGFERIGETEDTTFIDNNVENGFRYYYTVASVGEFGLVGVMSESIEGIPAYQVTSATVEPLASESVVLQYGTTVDVEASVRVSDYAMIGHEQRGILADAALIRSDRSEVDVVWTPMTYVFDRNSAPVYRTVLSPQFAGEFQVVVRFTVDRGLHWTQAVLPDVGTVPTLVVESPDDVTASESPTNFTITRAAPGDVIMTWNPVADADVAVYRIIRSGLDGNVTFDVPADATLYTDTTAFDGATYAYSIAAIDQAHNISESVVSNDVFIERGLIA